MRLSLICSIVLGLFFISACPKLKNSVTDFNNNQNLINQEITQDSSNLLIPSETPIPKLEFTPTEPMAWFHYISANESTGRIDNNFALENGTIDEDPRYDKIGMITNVDIFNCAGYLMSGRAQKRGNFGWKFEMLSETVVPNVIKKMKQCDGNSVEERKEKNLLIVNYIFAVAPTDISRRNVKTPNLDASDVFSQLPLKIQKKINDTSLSKDDAIKRNVKGEISAENFDQFVDIDGDGKVDLIYIKQLCIEPEPSGLEDCDFLLMKINGEWKVVGIMRDA